MEKETTSKLEDKAQISFSIKLADKMYFVGVQTIAFIYIADENVNLVDFNGNKHIIYKTLKSLKNAISAQQFHQVSRQMIVNRAAIKEVETYPNQRIVLHLTVPTSENVIVPRFKVKPFLNWMERG